MSATKIITAPGTVKCQIIDGPGEEKLFDALRKFKTNPDLMVQFTFVRENFLTADFRINGIAAEGGLHVWEIKGFVVNHPRFSGNITGYYNPQTRTGQMTFIA